MNRLERYIGFSITWGGLLVLAVLATLFGFVEVVEQLEDVGDGHYGILQAITFATLILPDRLLEVIPVVALLGSMVALGGMAAANELVATRAAGVSVRQLAWGIGKVALMAALLIGLLAEFVVPDLEQRARELRAAAISESLVDRDEAGFWARRGQEFINVRAVLRGTTPADIDIYRFTEDGRLTEFIHANWADLRDQSRWLLSEVTYKQPSQFGLETVQLPTLSWASFLTSEQLGLLVAQPESLAPSELYRYIADLKERGQDPGSLEFLLWRRLLTPFAVAVMILLALPFSIGRMRTAAMSLRVVAGGGIGIAFHFLTQILGHLGTLLHLNPALMALLPMLLLLAATWWLIEETS